MNKSGRKIRYPYLHNYVQGLTITYTQCASALHYGIEYVQCGKVLSVMIFIMCGVAKGGYLMNTNSYDHHQPWFSSCQEAYSGKHHAQSVVCRRGRVHTDTGKN